MTSTTFTQRSSLINQFMLQVKMPQREDYYHTNCHGGLKWKEQ